MYNALIVDDEKMIRNGIRVIIPWAKIGIGEVFMAADGTEALAIVEEKRPDILLTDIRMADMNGLMLIEKIRETNSDMRILVLTGYDSFEYAQRCLRLQVQDFILKPVDEDALTEALRRQVDALKAKVEESQKHRLMMRFQSVQDQNRLEQTMRGAVCGRLHDGALARLLQDYDYRADRQMQAVLVLPSLAPEQRGDSELFLALSIKELCFDMFDSRRQGITFEDDCGRIVVAAFVHNEFDEVLERVEQLSRLVENECGCTVRAVLGSVAAGIADLASSYREAVSFSDRVPAQSGEIFQTGCGGRRLKLFNEVLGEIRQAICSNTGDAEKMARSFSAFEAATLSYNLSNSYVRRCCFDIAAGAYYAHIAATDNSVDNRLNALLTSLQGCSREEACGITGTFIGQLADSGRQSTHEIVSTSIQYIRDHLSEDLSVSKIAKQLYVNANYLSRLFKKTTGEGCNEYIVRKRVEKAQSLLQTTNLKTGKIASLVGYRDANYFSLAFKKYSGMSPTAYREKAQGEMAQSG